MEVAVKITRVHENAKIPKYQKYGDAGFDFYASHSYKIRGNCARIVNTGVKMSIPKGYEVQIRPRSGMSYNTPLRIANAPGTIDSGYRGEIGIIVWNSANYTITVEEGDRIAQGVLNKVPTAKFEEVTELPDSERGEGGFGHTGRRE